MTFHLHLQVNAVIVAHIHRSPASYIKSHFHDTLESFYTMSSLLHYVKPFTLCQAFYTMSSLHSIRPHSNRAHIRTLYWYTNGANWCLARATPATRQVWAWRTLISQITYFDPFSRVPPPSGTPFTVDLTSDVTLSCTV